MLSALCTHAARRRPSFAWRSLVAQRAHQHIDASFTDAPFRADTKPPPKKDPDSDEQTTAPEGPQRVARAPNVGGVDRTPRHHPPPRPLDATPTGHTSEAFDPPPDAAAAPQLSPWRGEWVGDGGRAGVLELRRHRVRARERGAGAGAERVGPKGSVLSIPEGERVCLALLGGSYRCYKSKPWALRPYRGPETRCCPCRGRASQ